MATRNNAKRREKGRKERKTRKGAVVSRHIRIRGAIYHLRGDKREEMIEGNRARRMTVCLDRRLTSP
jgi:hypothetical protein